MAETGLLYAKSLRKPSERGHVVKLLSKIAALAPIVAL
jgi:hypothetical protein